MFKWIKYFAKEALKALKSVIQNFRKVIRNSSFNKIFQTKTKFKLQNKLSVLEYKILSMEAGRQLGGTICESL